MKKKAAILLTLIISLGLIGCSRTVEDVANWKTKGNIEKLIKALTDPKAEVRIAATQALGDLKAEPAVDSLAALYNDSEESVVLASVNALSTIGSKSTTTPMIAALKLNSPDARTTAAVALGTLKATGAIQPLAEVLDDSEETVQLAAAHSIGQIGDADGSAALVEKLNSPSVELRTACVESLGLTGGEIAAEGLIGALTDKNREVVKAAIASLVQLKETSLPYVLDALQNDIRKIRAGAIAVLREQDAIPHEGSNAVWFQLARASITQQEEINPSVIKILVKMDSAAVDTLLEAAGHHVSAFREHASLALERIGNSCTGKAVKAALDIDNDSAKNWYKERTTWNGSPSWRINLWSAVAALNPDFSIKQSQVTGMQAQGRAAYTVLNSPEFETTRAYVPLLMALLGDTTTPPPAQPDYDADGIPIVKKAIDPFLGETNQQLAKEKLSEAGYCATFPLISAIEDKNDLVAGHAAEILGEQGEKRALTPLMNVVRKKVAKGDLLTASPFYTALQKMDSPEAESLLLKVRPNSDRAMRIFERKYQGVRPMSAETKDTTGHPTQPVTFRLGYIDGAKVGELMVTFGQDGMGDWKPVPPLPDQLPE